MSGPSFQRFLLRWGGPLAALAAVSAGEAWLYSDAVLRGAASPPPRTLSLLAGAADGTAVLLDMFAAALPVNLLVFAWCRRRVDAQRAKAAALARTTLSPAERAKLKALIAGRIREELAKKGADAGSAPPAGDGAGRG